MHEQGQREFQAQTGIDIEHDIDYVVASLTDAACRSPRRWSWPAAGSTTPSSKASSANMAAPSRTTRASASSSARPAMHGDAPDPDRQHDPRLPRARPDRDWRYGCGQDLHRRAAGGAQHHRQQRNDGARLRHRPGNNAWAVGRFDVLAAQAQSTRTGFLAPSPAQVVRRGRPCERRPVRAAFAPRRATTRRPRTSATSSAASWGWRGCRPRRIPGPRRSSNRCSSRARARPSRSRSRVPAEFFEMIPKAAEPKRRPKVGHPDAKSPRAIAGFLFEPRYPPPKAKLQVSRGDARVARTHGQSSRSDRSWSRGRLASRRVHTLHCAPWRSWCSSTAR